ncbi:DUF6456 domain-containing protein [Salinarimonas rosea]|uniref:DUF6456 domain-containing protein n=1 Tax=Salinarimonas rosea TaxID=552063 RepID=UPI0004015028|nr:DUF6456 domain-containing protein [Salinarimonas rosea]
MDRRSVMEQNTNKTKRDAAGSPAARRSRATAAQREAGSGSTPLARRAVRLLEALAAPGASAFPDPVEEARVVVRAAADRRGVSLSAGAFPRADADRLVGADLARWSRAGRARRLEATDAGRAWLRRGADPAEPFAAQHRAGAVAARPDPADGTPRRVAVNNAESPLAWLASRANRDGTPFLSPAAVEAGERLRRDITVAGIMPGVTVDWSRFGGGGSGTGRAPGERQTMTETLVAARQRLARAGEALGGEDLDLLVDVCGFLKGLATIERERGWPARSAKMLVARALDRLARHYGLAAEARGRAHAAGIGVWRA